MDSVTVIFLFTDIEGSTARWERDREAIAAAVRRHDELMHAAIAASRGRVFKTIGDAFCAAFATVPDAVAAASEAQRALAREGFSGVGGLDVRMAIHAGSVESRDGDYFGPPLNRVSRLLGIGHGGQVLLSNVAADLSQGELPADVRLTHLGRHRLRDLDSSEDVYQVSADGLRSEFPALRSLEEFPNNLPLQLTSFVGREGELDRLRTTIETTRLLTLVGTGGVGKTRLALHLSAELLSRFSDGVWLVDLSPIRDEDAVAAETATVLAVRTRGGATVTESIAAAIGDKRTLLVLDGCEYAVSAAGALAHALLRSCPNLTLIVTSRQALNIDGEIVHNVDTLAPDAAMKLFSERATAASSRFAFSEQNAAIVNDICEKLDGIPLALELAAAKTAVLSVKELAEKLDQRFRLLAQGSGTRMPRQQTLRALIDWSVGLLDDDERTLLRRLSVFAGGCTLQAAAGVCGGDDLDEWRIFELLSSLVAKSLVVMEPSGETQRYRMLNSIREYAREQLVLSGEADAIAARHAEYFAALLAQAHALIEALEDVRWQRALAEDTDNLRAALHRTVFEGGGASAGLRILAELEWPELLTAPQEAIAWFEGALGRMEATENPHLTARILHHCVRLQWLTGRPNAQIEATANISLEAARASGEPNEIAHALSYLANCYRDAERFDEADALYTQASAIAGPLSPIVRNAILRNWAICDLQNGNVESARQRFTEVAALERPGSEASASALLNLGELEFAAGNIEAARAAARGAKNVFADLEAAPLALALCNLAAYAMAADELDEARTVLRDVLVLLDKSGARWVINALEHHALLAGLQGDFTRSAALLGYTDAHYASHGSSRQTTERYGRERLERIFSTAMSAEELARMKHSGSAITREQALAHATAISTITLEPASTTGG